MLTVLDEYIRQALAVAVRTRMGADDVLEALYPLLLRHEVLNTEWFTTTK
jgi:putative transposase